MLRFAQHDEGTAMIDVRTYGSTGPTVIVLHGGPGAPGSLAPVARELSNEFRVIEPLQRQSGGEPLTVARHVADLHEVIEARSADERPALVGHSWGANLALCYSAEHPESARAIALVCSGTWDSKARARMRQIIAERVTDDVRARLKALDSSSDEGLKKRGEIMGQLYAYELLNNVSDETIEVDARSNKEVWDDVVRLQEAAVYPAAFSVIKAPVLMLHGAHDPHPGAMIRDTLLPHIPHLEYVELERCGHDPWNERYGREEFFRVLREWLQQRIR
jgi:pimeloyl-ACP methyl ester carboxylesterase